MPRLIAGNWKMNGLRAEGRALAAELATRARAMPSGIEMAVFPPATLLAEVGRVLDGSPVALGGQDCAVADKGAYTGDISAAMLADLGCTYVIVGHSERRSYHRESDDDVARKVSRAHLARLCAVLCVGETAEQRDAGQALKVVADQVAGSLPEDAAADRLVVAYEPVWAIGTGRTPRLDDIEEVADAIRGALHARFAGEADGIRLLYGGSVSPGNAGEVLHVAGVDGALIGGASLKAADFWAIAEAASPR